MVRPSTPRSWASLSEDPALVDRIRVVNVLGPSTVQPVVASVDHLTHRDRASIRDVLVSLADDADASAALDAAEVARFVAVNAHAYADIGRMFDRVVRAGLLPAWWWPRWQSVVGHAQVEPWVKPLKRALAPRRGPIRAGAANESWRSATDPASPSG